VTRVEGHGKVTILLDEKNQVKQARLHIVEFRGFERFIQGRPTGRCRCSCSGCAASARSATTWPRPRPWTVIVGVEKLTPTAEKMRRLMHYGQMFQSHALHFFHLVLARTCCSASTPIVAIRNVIGVARSSRSWPCRA
jgi:NAD-reducing hydrogenase large subunit